MAVDTVFVLGLVLAVLSIPVIVSAISRGKSPRVATITMMIAGVMVVYAITQKPNGYPIDEIPSVVARVIGSLT